MTSELVQNICKHDSFDTHIKNDLSYVNITLQNLKQGYHITAPLYFYGNTLYSWSTNQPICLV